MGRWMLSVVLVVAAYRLPAQTWQVFDMATAGLPSNTVRAIAHGPDGDTWVGTDWGLCRYDGAGWEVFQAGSSGLPENDIRALAFDQQGRLWIGLFSQGVVVKDGEDWQQYMPGTSPLPSEQIHNIVFDEPGNAWICTTNGLAWTDLEEWHIYNNTDTSYAGLMLPGVNIKDIAVRSDGLACIGTLNSGFVYLTGSEVLVYNSFENQLPDNTALGVAIDSDGDRWTACPFGGLVRFSGPYDNGLFFQFITEFTDIPSNSLSDIVIDGADRKIIATQNAGLTILDANNTSWTTYQTGNSGLPDNELLCVSLAPDGAIWTGTASGGVARFDLAADLGSERPIFTGIAAVPNPFCEEVTIHCPGLPGPKTWELRDTAGRTVRQGSAGPGDRSTLVFGRVPSGSYTLIVQSGAGRSATRVVCWGGHP